MDLTGKEFTRKELEEIITNSKDSKWWNKNKDEIKDKLRPEILIDELKYHITKENTAGILKLLERMEVHVEESLLLDCLEVPCNINMQVYYSIFSLYQKGLISEECLERCKEYFSDLPTESIEECEKKYISTKIEFDRYNFKKSREDLLKVKDRKEEIFTLYKSMKPIGIRELRRGKGIDFDLTYAFVINVDDLFDISNYHPAIREEAYKLYDIIDYCRYKFDDIAGGFRFYSLGEEFPKQTRQAVCLDDMRRLFLSNTLSYYVDLKLLIALDKSFRRRFVKLRHALINFGDIMPVYLVSNSSLQQVLSEVITFNLNYVKPENIISFKGIFMDRFIKNVITEHNPKKIFWFGASNAVKFAGPDKPISLRISDLEEMADNFRVRYRTEE
ncbi:hypothetical protein TCON_1905 [Astathelohania contejeani]|uniref:Uncharacterized protein n=1 Tax=Astathelohania contejeani TaxID=164912 RepID=A0ABQ7HXH8_9MICR|nr:hypothetical protein TCON_1905 [Thelohania contejeani]